MKFVGIALLSLVGLAIALGLWALNCSGPRAVVEDVRLIEPAGPEAPYRVEALIRNSGPGHGQVQVIFRLRDPEADRSVEDDRTATLESNESVLVTADLRAPVARYEPEVEVEYPPR
jgi:hypothetical protein